MHFFKTLQIKVTILLLSALQMFTKIFFFILCSTFTLPCTMTTSLTILTKRRKKKSSVHYSNYPSSTGGKRDYAIYKNAKSEAALIMTD